MKSVSLTKKCRLPPASHTLHSAWRQCPRKTWHSFIARDVDRGDSEALAWGRHVHEALEKHLGKGDPLPDALQHHAHLYNFPPDGYTVQAEVKLAITHDRTPCDFLADDCYARGVLDVVILLDKRPDMAMLVDHKTGKVREDPAELEFHAVLLKAHYPQLNCIKGWYSWLMMNRMGAVHDLSDTDATWAHITHAHDQITHAYTLGAEAFPPKQGPLCGWCPVKHCEYHP